MDAIFRLASNFKGIIDILSGIVDTITMVYNAEGIQIQAMDGSHISMLYIVLKRDQFNEYSCVMPGRISFNVSSFKGVIKSMKDRDQLRIKHKSGGDELDAYLIDGDRRNKYQIKLLDIDTETIDMTGDMEHEVFIQTGKTALMRILTDIKNIDGSETHIKVQEDQTTIEVSSEQCSLKIKPAPETMRVLNIPNEPVSVMFASRYILNIQRMLAIAKPRIVLRLDSQAPLLIEMSIRLDDDESVPATTTGNKVISTMKYYLAPKIQDS